MKRDQNPPKKNSSFHEIWRCTFLRKYGWMIAPIIQNDSSLPLAEQME